MTPTEPNARAMNAAKLVAELNDIVSYHREMQEAIGSRFGAAWHREHGDTLQEAVAMIQALAERVRAYEALFAAIEDRLTLHNGVELLYVVDGYTVSLTEHDGATTVREATAERLEDALRAALRPGAPREEGVASDG